MAHPKGQLYRLTAQQRDRLIECMRERGQEDWMRKVIESFSAPVVEKRTTTVHQIGDAP